jgi:hypothetical protein
LESFPETSQPTVHFADINDSGVQSAVLPVFGVVIAEYQAQAALARSSIDIQLSLHYLSSANFSPLYFFPGDAGRQDHLTPVMYAHAHHRVECSL